MKAAHWIAVTLLTFGLGAGAVTGSSYAIDVFGIFHDPAGVPHAVQHNERTAKFFLNQRYVPANFDALLIGGSSTSNWPMAALDFAHFYNESLYGSNNVEEKRLVDQALQRGHFRFAVVVINPYMLQSHDFNEGSAVPPRLQALGSVNVLREELYLALSRLHHGTSSFTPDGGERMPASVGIADPYLDYTFAYDPAALLAMRQTLDELRARGTRILFLETPVYEPIYQRHKAQFERFYAAFPLRLPGELLVDMNTPAGAAFRADPTRWVDPPHLNGSSARIAAETFNRAVHAAYPELRPIAPGGNHDAVAR